MEKEEYNRKVRSAEFSLIYKYEIAGTWWSQYMTTSWLQELAVRYFLYKIKKKYKRYKKNLGLDVNS